MRVAATHRLNTQKGNRLTMPHIVRNHLARMAAVALLVGCAVAATGASASAQPSMPAIGGVYHWIKNSGNSNLCLEPAGQSGASGVSIVQEPCVSTGLESVAQGWYAQPVGTNHYKFHNQFSGLCLDAQGITNGAAVIQWPCVSISNEEFNVGTSLPAVAKIESRIHYSDTGYCLDEPGGDGTIGAAMQIYRCNGTPAQIWTNGF